MGRFKDFLSFLKTNRQIDKSVFDFKNKLAGYGELKSGQIVVIPDHELRTAVMGWMLGKIGNDWSKEFEVVRSLDMPCQNVYACCTFFDEVENGGFSQAFVNSSRQFAEMAANGFRDMGADAFSRIMDQANDVYRMNLAVIDASRDGTVEGFDVLASQGLFDELDKQFSEIDSSFEGILCAYIRQNSSSFGD